MLAAPPYRLYDFSASPFCIKVRAILDYKRIPFERIDTAHPSIIRQLKQRGQIGKVPALEMGERLICDSTDIAYELEEAHPEPSILPGDPRDRALCHVLEDWADESLYWLGVYYRWVDLAGRAGAGAIFPPGFLGQRVLPAVIARTARKQIFGQGVGRKPADHIARDLSRQLEHLSQLLVGREFLLATRPMLCDFAVCGQLLYLSRTPRGAAELGLHPDLGDYLARMRALRATPAAATAAVGTASPR